MLVLTIDSITSNEGSKRTTELLKLNMTQPAIQCELSNGIDQKVNPQLHFISSGEGVPILDASHHQNLDR
jgi:hypothetical protein